MARLERNIREDYLTCSICLTTFKDPRQLPCAHSYCLQCLLDYAKSNKLLVCPACRLETNCPDSQTTNAWLQSLPKDNLLASIITAVEKHSNNENNEQLLYVRDSAGNKTCEKHSKDLEYFCKYHNEAMCNDCLVLLHSSCDYFPISDIKSKLMSMKRDMDSKIERKLQDLAQLEQQGMLSLVSYQGKQKESRQHLLELRERFKAFATYVITDINAKAEILSWPEVAINSKLKTMKINRAHLEQARSDINNEECSDPVETMKSLLELNKQANSFLTDGDMEQYRFQEYHISITENEQLTSAMTKIKYAATLEIKSENDNEISIEDSISVMRREDSETIYQMFRHSEHWVYPDIRHHCSLSSVCIVQNFIIIIDQYNNCILRMTFNGTFVEKFTLPEPHQVCKTDENRVAVTCWDKTQLFILDVLPKFSIFQSSHTGKHYLGIHEAGNGRLLVTSPDSSVDVISTSGEVQFSIDIRRSRNILLSLFRNTVSVPIKAEMKGEDVIVCDSIQKLIYAVDLAGHVKWQRKIPGISGFACGQDVIYCTLSRLDKIITVTFDGQIKDNSFLKIKHPWSINVQGSTIVVTEDCPSGRYHVVELE